MRVLLVHTGFLGDVVLATPVISALKRRMPDAELTFLTTPAALPLVQYHPLLADAISIDKRGKDRSFGGVEAFAKELGRRRFDIAVSLHKSFRTSYLLWRANIPVRYGFSEAVGSFFYTHRISRKNLPHEVMRNLAIMRLFGEEPQGEVDPVEVALAADSIASAEKMLQGLRPVVLAPGSVWATKRWSAKGFAETVRVLLQQGLPVALIGGPADVAVGDEILSHLEAFSSQVINLIGKTSLQESAAVVRQSCLVITNDSVALHLASAMGKPTVALFTATVPEQGFTPWRVPHRVLGVRLWCRPCGRHGGKGCPTGTWRCVHGITSEMVLGAAKEMLASGNVSNSLARAKQ